MKNIKIMAVIPARYNSKRLPKKPLLAIGDRPMIEWVYRATSSCNFFDKVIVATDSDEIANCVLQFGGNVEMTSREHSTGTDRVAEVAQKYPEMEVVVNVQGDQPFVSKEMLGQLVQPYLLGELPCMTTLGCPIENDSEYSNPDVVKVLCDVKGRAIYFSRSPIPYYRFSRKAPVLHHLGLYAFAKDFLIQYSGMKPTPLEMCEGLEQLRVLEYGYSINVCVTQTKILEVNTYDDFKKAQSLV